MKLYLILAVIALVLGTRVMAGQSEGTITVKPLGSSIRTTR